MNGEGCKEIPRGPFRPIVIRTFIALMGLIVLSNSLRLATTVPAENESTTASDSFPHGVNDPASLSRSERDLHEEDSEIKEVFRQLDPNGVYAGVDTAQNRLWIKKGRGGLFEAVVSTWSGSSLIDKEARVLFCESPKGAYDHRRERVIEEAVPLSANCAVFSRR